MKKRSFPEMIAEMVGTIHSLELNPKECTVISAGAFRLTGLTNGRINTIDVLVTDEVWDKLKSLYDKMIRPSQFGQELNIDCIRFLNNIPHITKEQAFKNSHTVSGVQTLNSNMTFFVEASIGGKKEAERILEAVKNMYRPKD